MTEKQKIEDVSYMCVKCGSNITSEQLSIMLEVKCPNCGYRVVRKIRQMIVKRLKAR